MGYPEIGHLEFGAVEIAGHRYEHDVYVLANGTVKKRKKKRVKERHGTSHVIDAEELALLAEGTPAQVIVGTGLYGAAGVSEDGAQYLQERGIGLQVLPSAEAVAAFRQAKGRRALLLHVTC